LATSLSKSVANGATTALLTCLDVEDEEDEEVDVELDDDAEALGLALGGMFGLMVCRVS
jgi:hypothetical protein